jgi:uncharacterized membrane protein
MSRFIKIDLFRIFFKMKYRARFIVFLGGLCGTFISLWMFLKAVSTGHLATVTAIAGTGPVFAAIFEAIVQRKWPTRYLYYAFVLFGIGFWLVIR